MATADLPLHGRAGRAAGALWGSLGSREGAGLGGTEPRWAGDGRCSRPAAKALGLLSRERAGVQGRGRSGREMGIWRAPNGARRKEGTGGGSFVSTAPGLPQGPGPGL